ncbi:MAG TPA: hypothetical protein VF447_00120 [Terriglobales bacterium]
MSKFDDWFDREFPMDETGARPKYRETMVMGLMRQAWEAALEESAKACDEIAADCWSLYKGRAPYTGREAGRADPGVQGESDGADKCAEAIRSLAKGE